MPSIVVVGAQWGDEGKGKLVDYLTSKADLVVRFHGGNNAGHTLVVDGIKTKLSLVPSGILRPTSRAYLGAGVVVNPEVLLQEFEMLRRAGVVISPDRLLVDRDAHLILDYHCEIDQAREEMLGKAKIGTTGRGIGPAYEDRAQRSGVRFAELLRLDELRERVRTQVDLKNLYLSSVLNSKRQVSFDEVWSKLEHFSRELGSYVSNVSLLIERAIKLGQKIVFEGAQGTLLDQSFGTVPFVTSSSTISGAVATGCGIGPKHIGYVLGVAKAYCTRVGSGPFPTELTDEQGDYLRTRGDEYGTVTRRPRRCGWFDAIAMRRALRLNGLDSLAITKLDVMSGLEKIKLCVGYELDGQEIEDLPALCSELERVKPRYQVFEGWKEEISHITQFSKLPRSCQSYLAAIAEIVGCPLSIVSVGAERSATLLVGDQQTLGNITMEKSLVEQFLRE